MINNLDNLFLTRRELSNKLRIECFWQYGIGYKHFVIFIRHYPEGKKVLIQSPLKFRAFKFLFFFLPRLS